MIDGNTIQWLKANLEIRAYQNYGGNYGHDGEGVTVELILDGKIISSSST